MKTKIRLYDYLNYREYLKAYLVNAQNKNSNFSQRAWAQKMGFSSPARLSTILNGERNLGPKLASKIIAYFNYNEHERKYFLDLIKLEKFQDDPDASMTIYKRLMTHSIYDRFADMPPNIYDKVSDLHFDIIREFTKVPGFQSNPEWIRDHLNYNTSAKSIQNAIDLLLDLNILERKSDDSIISPQDTFRKTKGPGRRIHKIVSKKINILSKILSQGSVPGSEFTVLTFPASSKTNKKAKELIHSFWVDFANIIEDEVEGDNVSCLNINFTPLTKIIKKDP